MEKTDHFAKKQTKNRPKIPKSLLNRPKSVKTDLLSSTAPPTQSITAIEHPVTNDVLRLQRGRIVINILPPLHKQLHTSLGCTSVLSYLLKRVLNDPDEEGEDDEDEEGDEHVQVHFTEVDDHWVVRTVVYQHVPKDIHKKNDDIKPDEKLPDKHLPEKFSTTKNYTWRKVSMTKISPDNFLQRKLSRQKFSQTKNFPDENLF